MPILLFSFFHRRRKMEVGPNCCILHKNRWRSDVIHMIWSRTNTDRRGHHNTPFPFLLWRCEGGFTLYGLLLVCVDRIRHYSPMQRNISTMQACRELQRFYLGLTHYGLLAYNSTCVIWLQLLLANSFSASMTPCYVPVIPVYIAAVEVHSFTGFTVCLCFS